MDEVTLTIPPPPSTNQLYSGRRFKTERYKAWQTSAGWEIKLRGIQPVKGPFHLTIYLPGQCDLDNLKAIPDLLVSMGIIEDDRRKFMRKLTVMPEFVFTVPPSCRVIITPL